MHTDHTTTYGFVIREPKATFAGPGFIHTPASPFDSVSPAPKGKRKRRQYKPRPLFASYDAHGRRY